MKKYLALATLLFLSACYTPMNNSGVSTNKPWLDISGTRLDFKGEQYDSCFQFRLRFWPPELQERINLKDACISACCWRSEKNEVVLNLNQNFEKELRTKGRARRYATDQVTLKVTHSNFANYTKVSVEPRNAISRNGLLKVAYEEVENPARLVQLERQAALAAALAPAATTANSSAVVPSAPPQSKSKTNTAKKKTQKASASASAATAASQPAKTAPAVSAETAQARAVLQAQMGTQIDDYFYQMNKTYSKQGAVFILSSRLLPVTSYGNGLYLITCHAKARTGIDEKHLNAADFPCGKWLVNTVRNTVTPHDDKAKRIANP